MAAFNLRLRRKKKEGENLIGHLTVFFHNTPHKKFHRSVFQPPTIPTESFTYENNTDDTPISTKNVPYVKTKTQTVTYEKDGYPYETEDGILISSQSHSTRTQTIETTTVSCFSSHCRLTVVSNIY